MTGIYIADTETTGVAEGSEIIELAYAGFSSLGSALLPLVPDNIHCERFKPSIPIEWGALSTHHIFLQDLIGCNPSSSAAIPASCEYLIGHNIDFDWKMLGSDLSIKRICTLAMARDLYPDLDSHELVTMMYYIYGTNIAIRDRLRNAHAAYHDVIFCAELLQHICAAKNITSVEELYQYSEEARIPKKMAFGKHKGELVENVPYGYIKWYKAQPDPDPYLVLAFDRSSRAKYRN
jgi:exodeoxyribonuclease X